MLTVFNQVLPLFIFVAVGYILGKMRVCDFAHTKVLSKLLVYVFLPCNVFSTFSGNFTLAYMKANYPLLIAGSIVLPCMLVLSYFVAKLLSKNRYERHIYGYAVVIPNYGYMGYALALDIFGVAGQMNFMTFALPFSLYNYTIAISLLTKRSMKLKDICHPVLIATVLGVIAGLTGFHLPQVLVGAVNKSSACMAPISMLLTGLVTAEKPLKNLLTDKRLYPMLLLRMMIIPLAVGGVLSLFFSAEVVCTAVLFYTLPLGLNTVVYPKMVDENCEIGTGLALISTVVACVSIPLILSIFQ